MTIRATPASRSAGGARELDPEDEPFPREETPLPRDLPEVPLGLAGLVMDSYVGGPIEELLIRHGFPTALDGAGGTSFGFGLGAAFTGMIG